MLSGSFFFNSGADTEGGSGGFLEFFLAILMISSMSDFLKLGSLNGTSTFLWPPVLSLDSSPSLFGLNTPLSKSDLL